jgi:mannose-6-phosphate isomerase-like protein (cupin superfamily)
VIDVRKDRPAPLVVAPGEGTTFRPSDAGGMVTIKLASETTGGAVTAWESNRSAGDTNEPGLHSHPGFDEMIYVLAGTYAFRAGSRRFTAPAGTFVFMPRGIFHTFASTGSVGGLLLHVAVPGGIEDALEEMAVARGGG